nr:MAG TPA: hypothetical protein [Caudoviricetes sp.]
MINAHNKLYRNYLNLDYQIIDNYTSQTDNKLNNIINNIYMLINKNNYKNIIIESKNDIYTVILYRLLNNLLSLRKFNIYIIGKTNKIKEYLYKDNYKKVINIKKINNKLILNTNNPLYKVFFNNIKFNQNGISPFYDLTPKQFNIIADFYNIKNKNLLDINNNIINSEYQLLCDNQNCNFKNVDLKQQMIYDLIKGGKGVYLIKFYDNNSEENNKIIDSIYDTNNIIYYINNNNSFNIEERYNGNYFKKVDNSPNKKYNNNIIEESEIDNIINSYREINLIFIRKIGNWEDNNK